MVQPTLLALHGPLKSGKSTLAKALTEQYGFTYVNFTRDIKVRAARALSAAQERYISVEMIERNKEAFRPFLIELARAIGVDEGETVNEVLVEQLGMVTDTWPQRVVFDNVRYVQQMDKLLPYGFRLVRLQLSDYAQEDRARHDGLSADALFELRLDTTEQPLPHYAGEITLNADLPAFAVLEELVERLGLPRPTPFR